MLIGPDSPVIGLSELKSGKASVPLSVCKLNPLKAVAASINISAVLLGLLYHATQKSSVTLTWFSPPKEGVQRLAKLGITASASSVVWPSNDTAPPYIAWNVVVPAILELVKANSSLLGQAKSS